MFKIFCLLTFCVTFVLARTDPVPSFPVEFSLADDKKSFTLKMSTPDINRWVSVGFSKEYTMHAADYITCKSGLTPPCYDAHGIYFHNPPKDKQQDLTSQEILNSSGVFFLIKRKMDTGDSDDNVIKIERTNCIWGTGVGKPSHEHDRYGDFIWDVEKNAIEKVELKKLFHFLYPVSVSLIILFVLGGFLVRFFNVQFFFHQRIGRFVKHDMLGLDGIFELTVGELLFVIGMLISLVIFMLGYSMTLPSNPSYPTTVGRVFGFGSVVLFFFVMIPISHVSPVLIPCGMSVDRAIKYHRWAGRLLFVFMSVHFGIMYDWRKSILGGPPEHPVLAGFLSWVSVLLMGLFAVEPIRRRAYKVFLYSHYLFFIGAITCAILHDVQVLYAFGAISFFWLVDIILRLVLYSKKPEISLHPICDSITRLTVTIPGFKWGASQYVYLRCGLDTHPFSISNAPAENDPHTFRLYIKSMGEGTFTSKLNKMGTLSGRFCGPYGSLSVPVEKYSNVILLAGGIGVTPMACLLDFIVSGKFGDNCKIKKVTFIWSFREEPLLEEFVPLFLKSQETTGIKIDLKIFNSQSKGPVGGIDVTKGRPNFLEVFSGAAVDNEPIALCACGPDEMIVTALNIAQKLPNRIDFHTEKFYF